MRISIVLSFLFSLLLQCSLSAQVGVNNTNPEQALDVNGKIRVSDDATTPTDGTIRYNDPEATFEGFADGEWTVLNKSATPDRPIPVTLAMFNTSANGEWEDMDWIETHGVSFVFDLTSTGQRRAVPAGYFLVIEMIEAMGMDRAEDEQFRVIVAGAQADQVPGNGRVNPQIYVSGSSGTGNTTVRGGRAPLLVLQAGQQLVFLNDSATSNSDGVRMIATGFLVQDLDQYFTY